MMSKSMFSLHLDFGHGPKCDHLYLAILYGIMITVTYGGFRGLQKTSECLETDGKAGMALLTKPGTN